MGWKRRGGRTILSCLIDDVIPQAMRGKRLESARQSVIQNIQLEDDLQLEQDLLGEKFEQEYGLSNEVRSVE